jgi:hypothetical protein
MRARLRPTTFCECSAWMVERTRILKNDGQVAWGVTSVVRGKPGAYGSTKNPGKNQSTNAHAIGRCTYAAKVRADEVASRTTRDVGPPPARNPRLVVTQKVWEEPDNASTGDLSIGMCRQSKHWRDWPDPLTQESPPVRPRVYFHNGLELTIGAFKRDVIPGSGIAGTVLSLANTTLPQHLM